MDWPPWFWFAMLALFAWGVAGLLQKLATNHVSAESALIWLAAGFVLLEPWLYPGKALWQFSLHSLGLSLLGGALNALGAWALFVALKNGGKAAIVIPLTSLYPLVVVLVAPIVLHESLTLGQGAGIVCALGAIVLLST